MGILEFIMAVMIGVSVGLVITMVGCEILDCINNLIIEPILKKKQMQRINKENVIKMSVDTWNYFLHKAEAKSLESSYYTVENVERIVCQDTVNMVSNAGFDIRKIAIK